jgi:hypothetical protein
MIIAEPDHGKSQLILESVSKDAEILSNFSSKGLYDVVAKCQAIDPKAPIVLVVPDFNAIVERKASTSNATIANLLSILEEGTMKISDGGGTHDLKGVTASMITAMTPGTLKGRESKWKKSGFLRRFIPIYYEYCPETAAKIHRSIINGDYKQAFTESELKLPKKKLRVSIPTHLGEKIKDLGLVISERVGHRGFTVHKHFRSYAKARCILRCGFSTRKKKLEVSPRDVEDIRALMEFISLEKPRQI